MEAIILAGGLGTRLREVVADVPKPMAPVGGKPFLEIVLSVLAKKGFKHVVLSLGFMAAKISDYFGCRFAGIDITHVVEEIPLGTGGAIRLAFEACTENHVFIFNGDTYLDLEVGAVQRQWQANKHPIVVCKHVQDATRYGRLAIDGKRISGFAEKAYGGPGLINAGCYVLETNALARFPLNQPFSIETDYFMPEISRAAVEVFVTEGMFIDIGLPEDYARAQSLLAAL